MNVDCFPFTSVLFTEAKLKENQTQYLTHPANLMTL